MTKRTEFVEQARKWLYLNESDGSYQQIINCYNECAITKGLYIMKSTDPWCAAFVTAVAWKCELTNVVFPSANCDEMIKQYKAHNEWHERNYKPQIGDLIFYDWDGNGESDHVGIVDYVNGSTIRIIEGNKNDAVGFRSIGIGNNQIIGFGTPNFDGTNAEPVDKFKVTGLPTLKRGDKGETVRAAQFLLNGRKCSVGIWGADGDFGNCTEAAVLAFQRRNMLDADGIIGDKTWTALLGG